MIIELEEFSLRHIISQFREFDSATRNNFVLLTPYFWWARANKTSRFNLILSGVIAEKISHILSDLPYNKRFIIRADGKFAGVCGLDGVSQNIPRAEFWIFITNDAHGIGIASNAIKLVEEYARGKNMNKIYARTKQDNIRSKRMLAANGYDQACNGINLHNEILWYKLLNDKSY